jgi:hypothetical protein
VVSIIAPNQHSRSCTEDRVPVANHQDCRAGEGRNLEEIQGPFEKKAILTAKSLKQLEVRGGIEPPYADLQSAASPLCHRTALVEGPGISGEPHHKVKCGEA